MGTDCEVVELVVDYFAVLDLVFFGDVDDPLVEGDRQVEEVAVTAVLPEALDLDLGVLPDHRMSGLQLVDQPVLPLPQQWFQIGQVDSLPDAVYPHHAVRIVLPDDLGRHLDCAAKLVLDQSGQVASVAQSTGLVGEADGGRWKLAVGKDATCGAFYELATIAHDLAAVLSVQPATLHHTPTDSASVGHSGQPAPEPTAALVSLPSDLDDNQPLLLPVSLLPQKLFGFRQGGILLDLVKGRGVGVFDDVLVVLRCFVFLAVELL